jgi:hypothetical protein
MNALVLGRRRQGKSTLALTLGLSRRKTVVAFDPNHQYDFPAVGLNGLRDAMESGQRIIVYRPEDPVDDFPVLVSRLWPWSRYVLLVDECTTLQSAASLNKTLERVLRQSPRDVDLIQTTHRLSDTHRLTRMLSTDIFFFQTPSATDLKMVADEYSESLAAAIPRLGEYECAHWWLEQGGLIRWSVWDHPEDWYVRINDNDDTEGAGAGAETGVEAGAGAGIEV